jgi:hypothetical protein
MAYERASGSDGRLAASSPDARALPWPPLAAERVFLVARRRVWRLRLSAGNGDDEKSVAMAPWVGASGCQPLPPHWLFEATTAEEAEWAVRPAKRRAPEAAAAEPGCGGTTAGRR